MSFLNYRSRLGGKIIRKIQICVSCELPFPRWMMEKMKKWNFHVDLHQISRSLFYCFFAWHISLTFKAPVVIFFYKFYYTNIFILMLPCICLFRYKFEAFFIFYTSSCLPLCGVQINAASCVLRALKFVLKNPISFLVSSFTHLCFFIFIRSPPTLHSLLLHHISHSATYISFFLCCSAICVQRLCNCDLGCQISILCLSIFFTATPASYVWWYIDVTHMLLNYK